MLKKDLSEALEQLPSSKKLSETWADISLKSTNSLNNISEAWEFISLKYNHRHAKNDISEALEPFPRSKDLSEAHRVF